MAKKLFVRANTEAGLNAVVASGTLNAEVAFIEEPGKEGIHAKGKTYQAVPSNGKDGQILIARDGKGVWADANIEDMLSYGVEWKPNVGDPILTRVGNMSMHKSLPIQSRMKGCILNPVTKKVAYWLNEHDWNRKRDVELGLLENVTMREYLGASPADINQPGACDYVFSSSLPYNSERYIQKRIGLYKAQSDGTIPFVTYGIITSVEPDPTISSNYLLFISLDRVLSLDETLSSNDFAINCDCARLDGYDGEVFVYVPEFYIKSWDEKDRRCVRISTVKIDDSWEHQPALFVGAYKDTLLDRVPENMGYLSSLQHNTSVCIANANTYCRGADNDDVYDNTPGKFRRNLGKCRTNLIRSNFRNAVRQAKKEILSYRQYKNILYWLYVIEYADFKTQSPYKADLTSEGFHQGGLGLGITNIGNWQEFNNYGPICPNGYTNSLGNGTGQVQISDNKITSSGGVYAIRWRGIENPFGDTLTNVDGIIIYANTTIHPNYWRYVYVFDHPSEYSDSLSSIENMTPYSAENPVDGFIKEFNLGSTADIIPRVTRSDAGPGLYKCDYYTSGIFNDKTARTLCLGGYATHSSNAGLAYFSSANTSNWSSISAGIRSVCEVDPDSLSL